MTLILGIVALATIGTLCHTVRRQSQSRQAMQAHRLQLANEVQELKRQRSAVLEVLERSAGGLDKRISEHHEIVAAIATRQPGLFEEESGLKYWLTANAEFFHALKAVAAAK